MSWRIVLEGYVGKKPCDDVTAWADCLIPSSATTEEIEREAATWAWKLPLRVFTPSVQDQRFLTLVRKLSDLGQEPNSYRVFSSGFVEVAESPLNGADT